MVKNHVSNNLGFCGIPTNLISFEVGLGYIVTFSGVAETMVLKGGKL